MIERCRYGYIALFSPCFPLAPLLALINNVMEIRFDAYKLCKGYQRPTAATREDIGSWFAVLPACPVQLYISLGLCCFRTTNDCDVLPI